MRPFRNSFLILSATMLALGTQMGGCGGSSSSSSSSTSTQILGSLDTTFDTDGKVVTPVGSADDEARAVAVQADGKILVAGFAYDGSKTDFALTRYNSDGSLDTDFDGDSTMPGFPGDGKVTTVFPTGESKARAIAIQTDGKIVLAGYANSGQISSTGMAVARYNTDGTLDTTFDSDGMQIVDLSSDQDSAFAVVVDTNDNILIAGYTTGGSVNFGLARLTSTGALDVTFDGDGLVTTDFSGSSDAAYAMALQSDGKIVLAGYASLPNKDFALARYNDDGTLDTTFDTDGMANTDINGLENIHSIMIQSDGKIVAVGDSYDSGNWDSTLVRYDADGTEDPTFGSGGIVVNSIVAGDDHAYGVALQSDGKIVTTGKAYNGSDTDCVVVRYNANGTVDSIFGTDGTVTEDFGNGDDCGKAVVIQSNGKIVVAGHASNGTDKDFAVLRYE